MTAQYRWDKAWIRITEIEVYNVLALYAWESWFQPGPYPKPWLGTWVEVEP